MKKLLYFAHGLSANGIESFLVNVMKNIDRTKYDITVIIAIDEAVECLHEQTVLNLGVRVIHAGDMDSLIKKYRYLKNVRKLLKSENYDIVHANMDLLNGIILSFAEKNGVKLRICHAHNSKSQYNPCGRFVFLKKCVQKIYARTMKKLMLKSSTHLLACSGEAGKYFYGDKKYEIIFNGIDTDSFKMNMPQNYLGVNKPHTVVSVGRLSMQKNPLFAVEIANALKKIRNDFQFIWVGTGELESAMKDKISKLGADDVFRLSGLRTDIPEILNCSDVFLMPSLFEGLPVSLIEAQAAGLQCVVSSAVTKEADTGLTEYVSLEKSAGEWAEAVSRLLDNPDKKADSEKLKQFNIKNTVKQFEKIYG